MNKGEIALKILSRFHGCLLGCLVGDSLGAPFESDRSPKYRIAKRIVQVYLDELESKHDPEFRKFTDDTAMTLQLTNSIVHCKGLVISDLAKRFTEGYFQDPNRGYGGGVISCFSKLQDSNYADVFRPASEQFNGQGSMGNGAAMRISPLALLFTKEGGTDELGQMCTNVLNSSRITHTHPDGIGGAIFQAISVRQAFLLGQNSDLDGGGDTVRLRNDLLSRIESDVRAVSMGQVQFEGSEFLGEKKMGKYLQKLEIIRRLLSCESIDACVDQVKQELGVNVTALESIPTALFCFLFTFHFGVDQNENHFRRTIELAISLGGDTDTIASMAGSIAGTFYGDSIISKNLLRHCEDKDGVTLLAEQLYNFYSSNDWSHNPENTKETQNVEL